MDETSVRGLLETALGDEPPIGPVARHSLQAGIKLRRRTRIRRAAGGAAVVVAVAAVIPAVIGIHGSSAAGPHPGTARKGIGHVSTGGGPTPHPEAMGKGIAYVINSGGGTVTPIDLTTNTAGRPIQVSGEPVAMAITPDGKTAYVSCGATNSGAAPTSAQTVTPINLVTNTPEKPITLQWPPDAITITPDGKTAYMIVGFPTRTVTPLDLATNTTGKPVTLSGPPEEIAMAPDGKTAYVVIQTSAGTPGRRLRVAYDFMSFDLTTSRLGKPVKLSGQPDSIAIAPDGKTAYVAIYASGTVTPIDLATNAAGKPIKVSGKPLATPFYGQPMAIAISPDGKTAYVANGATSTVTPIDLATDTPGKPISLSGKPGADAIAITLDGTAAYVANQPSSTVTPIDLATDTAGKPVKIGHGWDSGFEAIVIAP
jgi:DNA-binding beta-propeller fold protein YncE